MSTTVEKLWETTRAMPEPLLAQVLDFAEFLSAKRAHVDIPDSSQRLATLCGGLETSTAFSVDPLTIQQQMRDEWH